MPNVLTVVAERSAVHAGDDAEPCRFWVDASADAEAILRRAADPRWLPSIYESLVAWSITSKAFLGVLELDCRGDNRISRILFASFLQDRLSRSIRNDVLTLRFNYHTADDADTVFGVLDRVAFAPE